MSHVDVTRFIVAALAGLTPLIFALVFLRSRRPRTTKTAATPEILLKHIEHAMADHELYAATHRVQFAPHQALRAIHQRAERSLTMAGVPVPNNVLLHHVHRVHHEKTRKPS